MSSFVHREGVNPNSMDGEVDPSDQNDDGVFMLGSLKVRHFFG